MKKILFTFISLTLLSFSHQLKASYRVVGYLADWGSNATNMINNMNYDALTHVNYAFAIPNGGTGGISISYPNRLTSLVTKAHAAGVKVNISVGGAGVTQTQAFSDISSSPTLQATFINNIVNFVKQYDLDGVDLDWEFPSTGEESKLESMLFDLRLKLNQEESGYRYMELTVATNGSDYYGKTLTYTATSYLDYVNIMSYDNYSSPGDHHSTVSYATACLDYWKTIRGVAASKLVLGVPFYSRPDWTAFRTISNSNAADAYNDADGIYNNYYYNSKPVLVQKANLVKNTYQAGGMMIWELSQDRTDEYSLLDVIGVQMGTYVGINEITQTSFNAYPNPFSESITFDFSTIQTSDENVLFEIFDITGKTVYSNTVSSKQLLILNNNFEAGMYLCKLTSSNESFNLKLIKE